MLPISSLKGIIIFHTQLWNPFLRIHTDITLKHAYIGMCAKGQIFLELSLMWIWVTCLLAFICLKIARIWPSVTPLKHYIRNPLDILKREELKSKKTIVHCFHSFLILEFASLYTLEHFVFFPSFPLLVSLLLRYGGLKWWRTIVSPIRRRADRGCHYCNLYFILIEISFPVQ